MAILQLDITENRPDGQAANERGELTDWQRERLVNQLEYPYQPHTRSFTVAATIALTIAVSLAIFTGMMWSSLRYPRQWHYRFIQAMAFGVLICFGIGCSGIFGMLWKRLRYRTQVRPHLQDASHRLANADYRIERWQGPVRFVIYPPGAYRMAGIESVDETCVIETPLHIFAVSKTLWESLRPHAENDFTLHYLTEPVPALLSIVHTLRSEPPTDSELSAVIGIGDDGELIYEEQGDQNRQQSG